MQGLPLPLCLPVVADGQGGRQEKSSQRLSFFIFPHRLSHSSIATARVEHSLSPNQHFEIETSDAAGVSFSPDGRYVAVWDSCLHYKIFIYSLGGRQCGSYTAYENALGIKSVQWAPSSQLLSIGSYDQAVSVLLPALPWIIFPDAHLYLYCSLFFPFTFIP